MVKIGKNAGRKTIAVISDMDQPLGFAVGNILEVKEAIDTLKGNGPADFVELCLTLGTQMLLAGGKASDAKEARTMLEDTITSGAALQKLSEFVAAQGGDADDVFHPERFPEAAIQREIHAPEDGYITAIVCDEVGICSLILGGGRETKESEIDLTVGIILKKKKGDYVQKGDVLAVIHANDEAKAAEASARYLNACKISGQKPVLPALIREIIS